MINIYRIYQYLFNSFLPIFKVILKDYHPTIIIIKNNLFKFYRIPSKGNNYRGPDSVTHLIYRGPGGVTPMRKFTEYLNVHILICLFITYL